jgi:3-hydroxyisobutyrate dehydrogenase-like beta-hydroxyacid dehydrogenase
MASVGFVGLGIMGQPMCVNVLKGGHKLWVFDVDKNKINDLVKKGAKPATSIADLATRVNYVIIMVPNSNHVQEVVNQLLPKLKRGTIIIDMSTISPTISKALAKKVADAGSVMIDAPVVKSQPAAVTGELGILVGCDDPQILEKIKPILLLMGKNIVRMGGNGSGLVMKLCHNSLVAEIQNGVNEMLVMGLKAGLDFDSFIKAIAIGGGQNLYLDSKAETIKKSNFAPKFPFEHMAKDLTLTEEMMKDLGLDLPGLKNCLAIFGQGMQEHLQREDHSASFKIVEKLASKK